MQFLSYLAIAAILMGMLLIAALIIHNGPRGGAHRWLAASLACGLGYFINLVLLTEGLTKSSTGTLLVSHLLYLSPAALYFYVRQLVNNTPQRRWQYFVHLLPFLVLAGCMIWISTGPRQADWFNLEDAQGGWPPNGAAIYGMLYYLICVSYLFLSLRWLRFETPPPIKPSAKALTLLLSVHLLLSFTGLVIALLRLIPDVALWPRGFYSTSATLVIYYTIALIGLLDPDMLTSGENIKPTEPKPGKENQEPPIKYRTSALTPEVAKTYWENLQQLMVKERPFLNNKLRIADLSKQLDVPENHLSQIINQFSGNSFFEFVNGYRVEEAKHLLNDRDLNIGHVAVESGFNSQSAFYRCFKQATGLTPRQYQQSSDKLTTS